MQRTGPRLLLAIGCSVLVLAFAPAARAAGPVVQGWWTSTTPGGGAIPVPVPVPIPTPPDVPADGLLVQGAGETPIALAALRYEVPTGATVISLVLTVAEGSASSPAATLRLCPLTSAGFTPTQGGPIADAPSFDCANAVSAAIEPTATTFTFDAAPLVTGTSLAVAVVGSSPTDRVVLAAPGADSLAVNGGSTSTTPPTSVPLPAGSGASTGSGVAIAPTGGTATPGIRSPLAPGSVVLGPLAPAAAPNAALPASPVVPAFAPTFLPSTEAVDLFRAALLLVALAGGATLWGLAGRPRNEDDDDAGAQPAT